MTSHQRIVGELVTALGIGPVPGGWELAEAALVAVEPLIRADEREQWATHEAVQSSHIGMLLREAAHAEAVAARLVEVICDMDDDHQIDEQALRYVRNQRDAARAEVERLRSPEWEAEVRADEKAKADLAILFWEQENKTLQERWARASEAAAGEHDRLRAEVAALREQVVFLERHVNAEVDAGREVLADLRAKVEGMRDEAKADPVGSAVWRTTAYESVLALIEEAQND